MKDMMEVFAKYAKEQFGCDISLKASSTPDTFESIFGVSFIKQNDAKYCHNHQIYTIRQGE